MIYDTQNMASGPITTWQIDGEKVEIVTDFIFLDSKITADSDWSQETKRHLLLGTKAMTNLDSILKSKDITLPTKGPYSQSYGFSAILGNICERVADSIDCDVFVVTPKAVVRAVPTTTPSKSF